MSAAVPLSSADFHVMELPSQVTRSWWREGRLWPQDLLSVKEETRNYTTYGEIAFNELDKNYSHEVWIDLARQTRQTNHKKKFLNTRDHSTSQNVRIIATIPLTNVSMVGANPQHDKKSPALVHPIYPIPACQ